MTKLEQIKAKLAKILLQFTQLKTDKGILEFDKEELAVGDDVYLVDENGERATPENGEYVTEDEKTIVVDNGKVTEIREKEETVEPEEATEETVEEELEGEEVTEEVIEEPVVEEVVNEVEERITALETKVEELVAIIEQLLTKVNADTEAVEERLSKIEKMSASKEIETEIELKKTIQKTGNSKVDRFLERYGK